MKKKSRFIAILVLAFVFPAATMLVIAMSGNGRNANPPRPEGPCDIYAAAGNPCVAAHSSTRALYASYNGPLYQIMRLSDGKTMDIGIVQPGNGDPGGYADAADQDAFCANTYCWITTLYDQSGKGNHLTQAPRGGFSGPAMGGFNNIPIADMAPVSIMGHKVYGIFIEPGMGLRDDDPVGTAVDDQAEGQYWVISGHHYNNGCCFDYGNAETDSRDDGDGTMETTYYGNANYWYHGQDAGPWIMTDQENNLVGCVNESPNDKYCPDLPSIPWRFVTATADGEPHHWRSMGGNAQQGDLEVMFDGTRIINDRNSYDPMRKQGAILLGNGGDNSNGSQGTFYEGAMTAPGTFPTKETNQKIQANIVAARYDVQQLSLAPANSTDAPPGLQTFSPRSSQNTTVTFINTSGSPVKDLTISISVPKGWKSVVLNSKETSKKFTDPIASGESVKTTFTVTSGSEAFNGDIVGKAFWTNPANDLIQSETIVEKVRNVSPVKINEFAISSGSSSNSTNSFIELYNASDDEIDISNWSLTHHPTQLPVFSSIKIPSGTKLSARGFYLLGLSCSGLAIPAKTGEATIYVRSTTGMSVGDIIKVGTGSFEENRTITGITTPPEPEVSESSFRRRRPVEPGNPTTVWQPLPDGPVITIPIGSNSIPVTSVEGFEVGQKMALGYGATYPTVSQSIEKYEVVTITDVGKPGTQAWLSMDAKAGDTNIKVSSVENISVGDKIRLDINSEGHGIETVTVTGVGTKSSRSTFNGPLTEKDDPGTGLDLAEPLKFDHASNMPFSFQGTGISFEPATAFEHSSNEPVLPLCYSITLDKPLSKDHTINSVVSDEKVTLAGYQGTQEPDQWFGGPALSSSAGNMVLYDAEENVVDGLNYGGLVDPWIAEGYQATSGTGENGCFVPVPVRGRGGFGMPGTALNSSHDLSVGRFPDGSDSDSNCRDFQMQNTVSLSAASEAGSNNIKVASVSDFRIGQKIIIDTGTDSETATIATIGTAGGTTLGTTTGVGTTVIPVPSVQGFGSGQPITIGSGTSQEAAIIASVSTARRRFGFGNGRPMDTIIVVTPLKIEHLVDAQVSGSGITLAVPLTKSHNNGAPIASNVPTPGKPNEYIKKK
ncbi:MAG: lamin tail domain-containing protein [Bacteroidales bacterium]|nr:lamin tail domain-containing protein [Bacteroidales bacterium]MBN2774661.1 lamin tail domain-containing protein [Prolixibacteraceae bacterium]